MIIIKKVISFISSAVVWVFGIANILAVILYFSDDFGKVEKLMGLIVGIDLLSWIPFVVFSIATLIIKIIWKKEVRPGDKCLKYMKADIIFHILFSLVSFASFVFLFSKAV